MTQWKAKIVFEYLKSEDALKLEEKNMSHIKRNDPNSLISGDFLWLYFRWLIMWPMRFKCEIYIIRFIFFSTLFLCVVPVMGSSFLFISSLRYMILHNHFHLSHSNKILTSITCFWSTASCIQCILYMGLKSSVLLFFFLI